MSCGNYMYGLCFAAQSMLWHCSLQYLCLLFFCLKQLNVPESHIFIVNYLTNIGTYLLKWSQWFYQIGHYEFDETKDNIFYTGIFVIWNHQDNQVSPFFNVANRMVRDLFVWNMINKIKQDSFSHSKDRTSPTLQVEVVMVSPSNNQQSFIFIDMTRVIAWFHNCDGSLQNISTGLALRL